ncbi:RNA polymerase Rpb4-domain-containing protein [Phanerochaete sordida]|uniref:DNA-directed RNA polymerase III subunit RPC9 n=1 Tax=Phanerochaete sordida TaxID=48140 RepID=A0A9P3GLR3_9APHY|nr:RNA polymerase Rpb4-domain-containing protein [Phanerochaete sordida]
MEVVDRRSALLSNYEVLTLLRELESDHLAKARTALRIKKEEEASGSPVKHHVVQEEVCENLRTIEVEAIQYLAAEHQPTGAQSDDGIVQLTKKLSAYDLAKAEKLQIVNLAPTEPVELYVIVEELEDRFGDRIDDMLQTVRSSLTKTVDAEVKTSAEASAEPAPQTYYANEDAYMDDHWEHDANEIVFDDTGEGAGIEGDLDVDDD